MWAGLMLSKQAYNGRVFSVEFYMHSDGSLPALDWLDSQPLKMQVKFAVLFKKLGDIGKIFNEQKLKHLIGTTQLFEFKADQGRILCFFFVGKRVILTHGFLKKSDKTPRVEIDRAEDIKCKFLVRSKT